MAPVSHGTSACASSTFAPPTTNKIGAMGAMVPAYFSMADYTAMAPLHFTRLLYNSELRLALGLARLAISISLLNFGSFVGQHLLPSETGKRRHHICESLLTVINVSHHTETACLSYTIKTFII